MLINMDNLPELDKIVTNSFETLTSSGADSFGVTKNQILDVLRKCFKDQFKEDDYVDLKMQAFIDKIFEEK